MMMERSKSKKVSFSDSCQSPDSDVESRLLSTDDLISKSFCDEEDGLVKNTRVVLLNNSVDPVSTHNGSSLNLYSQLPINWHHPINRHHVKI